MLRNVFGALALLLSLATIAPAQDWAVKMFGGTMTHDFGTVARGAKVVYAFKVKNLYKETVHVASVRSSCGCTEPSIVNKTINTHETGEILAQFNTRSFLGHRSATITVTFDKPFYAEVQLHVQGNIRGDVVFNPGAVAFGTIEQGSNPERKVTVNYAGRDNWKLLDVQSTNSNFEVEMDRVSSGGGLVSYELIVRLKPETPAGYLNDQLILVTNDASAQQIPLEVQAIVAASLAVSPAQLYLGDLRPGEPVTKQIVVKGKNPFRITSVHCPNKAFQFKADESEKQVHVVAVTFQPGKVGKVQEKIEIRTSLGESVTASLVALANVMPAEEPTAEPATDEPGQQAGDDLDVPDSEPVADR